MTPRRKANHCSHIPIPAFFLVSGDRTILNGVVSREKSCGASLTRIAAAVISLGCIGRWAALRRHRAQLRVVSHQTCTLDFRSQYLCCDAGPHVAETTSRCAIARPARSISSCGVGECSWCANQRQDGVCRQIAGLQISAVKISGSIAVENSSARLPSTLIRETRPSRFASLPGLPTAPTATASALSTTGSTADRRRRCPSRCASSARFIRNERWLEGEPRECDGSAWDRLPPLVRAQDRSVA